MKTWAWSAAVYSALTRERRSDWPLVAEDDIMRDEYRCDRS